MTPRTAHNTPLIERVLTLLLALTLLSFEANAQEKVSLQVKTFDQNLKPLPDIEIALNSLDYFSVGAKGTTIIEVSQSELPVKAVRVKDEAFEAASWNLSKGTIEIVIRPVSYKVMHVSTRFADGAVLANTPVKFHGSKTISVTSDQLGKFDLPISLYENIESEGQFEIDHALITNMTISGNTVVLSVERPRPKQAVQPSTTQTVKPEQPKFDLTRLDSIKTLAEFYAMFRDISLNGMDNDIRLIVDEKFKQLVALRQDSIRANEQVFIKSISDSSLVLEDIQNLLRQATAERTTLSTNREEFTKRITVISSKLRRGVTTLSSAERTALLRDIDMLELLLTENESQFYETHNDYREIINTLREKYLEVEQLQNRLSEAEKLREQQNREFRERLIGISAVVTAFGLLIILLITFSTRLKRQTKSLRAANDRIEQINANLESIVTRRTHLLEEANKELDTFLYRASHDLRSPVLSMMGLMQIIDHVGREEMVQHVRLATDNMNRIINKLIDISEISQEAKNHKTINILETINKVRNKNLVMMEGGRSRDRGAIIVNRRPVQFDVECSESLQLHTSPSLIEIILDNLIANAIFFASLKRSDDPLRVEVKAKMIDNILHLSVFDNGVGIVKAVWPKVFSMFFTGNINSKGSGLGLYTVKKCVIALHGTITFDSEEGKFTRFSLTIPPLSAETAAPTLPPADSPAPTS